MNKFNLLYLFLGILIVSCTNDVENSIASLEETIITANIEGVSSRTNFTSAGKFFWTKGDMVKVYTTNSTFSEFKAISGTGSSSATFSGVLNGNSYKCAVFPSTIAKNVSSDELTITLPTSYWNEYTQENYATEMEANINSVNVPMVAKINQTGSLDFNFKNLAGVFCFKFVNVPANTSKITFTANSKITGDFTINLTDETPIIETSSISNPKFKSVTVEFEPSSQNTNRVVYFPVPCGTYDGFKIDMYDENDVQTAYLSSDKSKTVTRSKAVMYNPITVTTITGGIEEEETNKINGHEYVDLGLPSGTKWATCNVGAQSPEEFGDYYAFGSLEPCEKNYLSTDNCITVGRSIAELQELGCLDENRILTLQYDVANYLWGSTWRVPTDEEIIELISNTLRSKDVINGVAGLLWTSKINGNSIFTPFTDIADNHSDSGYYRSSKATPGEYQCFGLMIGENSDGIYSDYDYYRIRKYGFSVRPVTK